MRKILFLSSLAVTIIISSVLITFYKNNKQSQYTEEEMGWRYPHTQSSRNDSSFIRSEGAFEKIEGIYPISKNAIEDMYAERKFWIKLIFSVILCAAALYVVLSKKYEEDTKKWAFSVLTMISGVWIGSL